MTYRINCNIIWDIESELSAEEVFELAKTQLKDKIFCPDSKTIFNIDCLKEKTKTFRLGEIKGEEFWPFIGFKAEKKTYLMNDIKYTVKMNSSRYFLFKKNPCCVSCGIKGEYLFLEKNPADQTAHVNLYAKDADQYIMMTKDHIKAKSIGGLNRIDNYQTMCQICNNLKSDFNLKTEDVAHLKKVYNENKSILPQKKLAELISFEQDRLHKPWHVKPNNQFVILYDLDLVEKNGILVGQLSENGKIKAGTIVHCTLVAKKEILVNLENLVFLVSKDHIEKYHAA